MRSLSRRLPSLLLSLLPTSSGLSLPFRTRSAEIWKLRRLACEMVLRGARRSCSASLTCIVHPLKQRQVVSVSTGKGCGSINSFVHATPHHPSTQLAAELEAECDAANEALQEAVKSKVFYWRTWLCRSFVRDNLLSLFADRRSCCCCR